MNNVEKYDEMCLSVCKDEKSSQKLQRDILNNLNSSIHNVEQKLQKQQKYNTILQDQLSNSAIQVQPSFQLTETELLTSELLDLQPFQATQKKSMVQRLTFANRNLKCIIKEKEKLLLIKLRLLEDNVNNIVSSKNNSKDQNRMSPVSNLMDSRQECFLSVSQLNSRKQNEKCYQTPSVDEVVQLKNKMYELQLTANYNLQAHNSTILRMETELIMLQRRKNEMITTCMLNGIQYE